MVGQPVASQHLYRDFLVNVLVPVIWENSVIGKNMIIVDNFCKEVKL